MKKNIILCLLLLLSYVAEAQMVSTSTLIVTKEKFPAVERGYESMAEVSPTLSIDSDSFYLDLNYIGGYRFNNTLFLGVGTGVNFNIPIGSSDLEYMNKICVPLYAHARVYILKGRLSPFVSLSLGARLSTKRSFAPEYEKYSTNNFLINPRIGVNYRFTPKQSVYLSLGYEPIKYVSDFSVYPTIDENSPDLYDLFKRTVHCIKITLGITF